jgi:MFS transporter, SP family, solute carrier family 2 (myo-inositol transporter), member 13
VHRYYSATILKLAGFTSTSQAIWLSAAVAFCNFVGSCAGLLLVERIGRRPLTLISQAATVLLLGALSLCFYYAQTTSKSIDNWVYNNPYGIPSDDCSDYKYCFDCVQDDHCGFCSSVNSPDASAGKHNGCIHTRFEHSGAKNETVCSDSNFYAESCPGSEFAGWMIFLFLCVYLLGFSPGMGPMPWCINSEIYPTSFRGMGNSISTTINWSTNILMSMTFLTLINFTSKQGAFMIYALISLFFLAIYAVYLPETKGKPLEMIRLSFLDGMWGRMMCRKDDEAYAALIPVLEADDESEPNGEESLASDVLGPLLAYRGKSSRIDSADKEAQFHVSSGSGSGVTGSGHDYSREDSYASSGGMITPERSLSNRPSITNL